MNIVFSFWNTDISPIDCAQGLGNELCGGGSEIR
jgi:hypothetical protein